ncbi:uncharacterized protein LOC128395816 [Panonychus citri]|uniref:uncharacterized protein LOC128395816 n=1 Tax=Panonychus citri TaxID=50023 RepID=UPI002306FAA4|nr:uncharacterized protein LOC128395816 [Panonychus citri]
MDNLLSALAMKERKRYRLELEKNLLENDNRELVGNITVKEAELKSIQEKINESLAIRGNAITEAIDAHKQRLNKCKEELNLISSTIKKYQEVATSTIEDSVDLDKEIIYKENDLIKTITQILEEDTEPYEPAEKWLKDEHELKKKAKEMIQSDNKFLADRVMFWRNMNKRLTKISLPRAELTSSQSTVDLDEADLVNLHNLLPEE